MYLHIGQNEIIPDRRIIGIFDLDKCSYGKRTREYLAAAEKEGVVLDEPIKAFGSYQVKAKLGFEVTGTVYVSVFEEI